MRFAGRARKGSSMLEFTFVAIPVMFILVGIFELSRAMWVYNTISNGVKEGTRFAIVHGNNCSYPPNNCKVTIGQICGLMQYQMAGLDPELVTVTLQRQLDGSPFNFTTLTTCLASSQVFPSQVSAAAPNAIGSQGQWLQIRASYRFDSALAFYWTGQRGFTFGRFNLGAVSRERIQY